MLRTAASIIWTAALGQIMAEGRDRQDQREEKDVAQQMPHGKQHGDLSADHGPPDAVRQREGKHGGAERKIAAVRKTPRDGGTAPDDRHQNEVKGGKGMIDVGRHGSTHQLSWAALPKTPAGTGHPLPGGLYWEQQKNRGTGECGMVQELSLIHISEPTRH